MLAMQVDRKLLSDCFSLRSDRGLKYLVLNFLRQGAPALSDSLSKRTR
jgi:hypothetical protein